MDGDQQRGIVAQNLLDVRWARQKCFPSDLFDEHAWNILLVLFASGAKNRTMSERELIAKSGTSGSVGQRWIKHLIKAGQLDNSQSSEDIVFTPVALQNMRQFLDQAGRIHGSFDRTAIKN